MSQVLILLHKGVLMFWRAKAAVALTFLVPIVLIYIFGHVFNLYPHQEKSLNSIPLAVVNLSTEPVAVKLIDALKAEKGLSVVTDRKNADGTQHPLTEADVRAGLKNNDYRFALILPADLLPEKEFGVRMKFLTNPRNEIETQIASGLLQKTVFSHVPELLGQSLQKEARRVLGDPRLQDFNRTMADTVADYFGGDREKILAHMNSADFGIGDLQKPRQRERPPVDPSLRRLDIDAKPAAGTAADPKPSSSAATDVFSQIVKIETEQVSGKHVTNPMAARVVGGYAIMFLLFAVSGSATTLFDEKNSGIFVRLLSAPVRPAHILWARFLFGMILGLVQLTAMFLTGDVLFGLDLFSHAGALIAVGLSAAAACSAFGLLIAAISPSQAAAAGLATFLVISMSAVGGAWFPVSLMPDYIQRFSKLTITYWSVEGFTDVLWAGQSLLEVLPRIGVLAAIAAGALAFSLWRFNRSSLFD
jgi:ABC-2 type transport system permease protein